MSEKWKSPLYPYKLARREITVDVTRSCPSFDVPTPGVPDVAAELRAQGKFRVLDFGAGKLRNALFLLSLDAGFKVWAIEFESCLAKQAGQQRLAAASKYKSLFLKEWPHEFLGSDFEVDAVLLVNVANVVPEKEDRKLIVSECTKRLVSGGWFLWMSQFGEPGYKPNVTKRLSAPDGGWFYRLHEKRQTYYKEFSVPEIISYFNPKVFKPGRKVKSPHHRAFLFEKI